MALVEKSIVELHGMLCAGEIRPGEIIESVAEAIDSKNDALGGYLSFDVETALDAADHTDGDSLLGGIPIAIKDLINVKGQPCSCASKILHGAFTSPYDAGCISRLRAAGGVPLGRTNMDEFAMGSSTENSALAKTVNPWSAKHVPGGSSGGSAAVVAGGIAVAALGSDTGGSIRQPASFCGCVGLKPTYGRVSRFGLVAFASSLDQIGPMTRSVEDAAVLFEAIYGTDPHDTTSIRDQPEFSANALQPDTKGKTLGVPREYFAKGIDPQVRSAVEDAIKKFTELGAEIEEVTLPHTEYAVAVYYIIATAEASANLARFDGVRYGQRRGDGDNLLEMYRQTRAAGFGTEVKRRILLGTHVLSSGYYDAYYLTAQKARNLIRRDFENVFSKVDALIAPVSPTPAFPLGSFEADPLQMYLADICTIPANLAGICGLSVPAGFAESDGVRLPVGVQLLGPALGEQTLLELGMAFEQATEWHKQRPNDS